MKKDRTYWRQANTRQLVEAGKESADELSIALAERLEDTEMQAPSFMEEGEME